MNAERAKRRLSFYFRTLYEGMGWEWEHDNQSEIEELVEWLCEFDVTEEEAAGKSYAEYYHGYGRTAEEKK